MTFNTFILSIVVLNAFILIWAIWRNHSLPKCYRTEPNEHEQLENKCGMCPHRGGCL